MSDKELISMLSAADKQVRAIMQRMIAELAAVGIDYATLPDDEIFLFKNYAKADKKAWAIVDAYSKKLTQLIQDATTKAMQLSYNAAARALSAYDISDDIVAPQFNSGAVKAFERYQSEHRKGQLSLSQRVWNYTSQTKSEFELAMNECIESGIKKGTSAESLARSVRARLNRPDAMYRRYHIKRLQDDGTLKDTVEWRRRTIDENGKAHFTDTDIEAVGRGVYRSARQNALRLASNEINMAYRYADYLRMNDDIFCRGFRIQLSNNHPDEDICDELQGDYPKSFVFTGWHPRCRCSVIPLMCSLDERLSYLKLTDEQKRLWQPRDGYITDYPAAFKRFCTDNTAAIATAAQSGRGAYFVRDNASAMAALVSYQQ